MKRIGVVLNPYKPAIETLTDRLAKLRDELGLTLVMAERSDGLTVPGARVVNDAEFAANIDVLVSLGGDGTMLKAAHLLHGADVPILGVNLGHLGFLTAVTEERMEGAITAIARGDFETSTRSVLDCTVLRNQQVLARHRALNDIVTGWGQSTRIITIHVRINDEDVTSYRCDGLILTTPTGSTGHSLSAGGPILHPESSVFLLNVICPHTLSTRPIVLPDDRVVSIDIRHTSKELLLSVDGTEQQSLMEGDQLTVRRSGQPVRLIQFPGHSYFQVLRQKLQWRGSTEELM